MFLMDEKKLIHSFQKIREDILFLKEEIFALRDDFSLLLKGLSDFAEQKEHNGDKNIPTQNSYFQTHTFNYPTQNSSFKPLNTQKRGISKGNGGVPTDRQTDRQTDRHIISASESGEDTLDNALDILNSLDSAKKEIRLKFKRLTDQEFLVFSTLYQMEEEMPEVNYKTLSDRLHLTESSVRDYVGKLIKKGVPVEKEKVNNKSILLRVSQNLKNLVSLPTILQLRDI